VAIVAEPRRQPPPATPAGAVSAAAAGVAAIMVAGAALVTATWWRAAPPPSGAGSALTDAGRLTGLLAGYVALLQVTLRIRLPVVEHKLGTDSINDTHRLLGGYLIVLIVGHATLITAGYAQAARSSVPQQLTTLVTSYPYIWWAVIAASLLIGIAISSLPVIRGRLLYEAWHGLHLLVYAALALAFFHQVTVGEHFRHQAVLRAAWTVLFAGAGAAVLVFRFLRPWYLSLRHRLVVGSVVHETPDILSIRVTGRNIHRLHARPGQYFRWRFLAPGAWYLAHPYSLSEEPDGQSFRITVRIAGRHTAKLAQLPAGTRVIAEGPCGGLIAGASWAGPVALIACGIGITPLRALFATAPCAEHAITLVYRVHDAADIVFRAELEQIAARRGGTVHFLTGRRDDPRNDLSPASLTRLCPDLAWSRVFVCGPAGYAQAIRASLAALGVPRSRVRSESFRM
jgi:ferredoxin-NADP reductase/DMSO/TMAO reductase YedYZ heme-binding membrane subunit